MRSRLVILLIASVLTACVPVSTGRGENPSGGPGSADQTNQAAEPMVISTGTGQAGAYTEYQQGALSIQIYSPLDGEVFNTSKIEVRGKAPVDTVISINDQIILVSASGDFSTPFTLDEGPNVIELVASDVKGNELDIILTLSYEP